MLPRNAALAGVAFRHQVLSLELDPFANLSGVASSNALLLTIGTL